MGTGHRTPATARVTSPCPGSSSQPTSPPQAARGAMGIGRTTEPTVLVAPRPQALEHRLAPCQASPANTGTAAAASVLAEGHLDEQRRVGPTLVPDRGFAVEAATGPACPPSAGAPIGATAAAQYLGEVTGTARIVSAAIFGSLGPGPTGVAGVVPLPASTATAPEAAGRPATGAATPAGPLAVGVAGAARAARGARHPAQVAPLLVAAAVRPSGRLP